MDINGIRWNIMIQLIACTPYLSSGLHTSKESNIVLVWCDSFPYHTLDFFGPRTFEKLVPTPLVEFQGWGPTCFLFSKLCAIENCSGRFRDWFPVFFMFFSSLPGMKISCDVPEMGWSQKMVEGWFASSTRLVPVEADFQAHPGRSADIWRRQPLERSAMKSSGCDQHPKMLLIVQYLYWCFCFLVSQ